MKNKISLLFCILFLYSISSIAQVGEYKKIISLGVNAGFVGNKINFDPLINQYWKYGPNLGLSFRIISEQYFKAYCALQVELNYANLGWKENIYDLDHNKIPDNYSRNLHYIQIPFMSKIGWGKVNNGIMGSILLGPQLNILFKDKENQSKIWTKLSTGIPNRLGNIYQQYSMPINHIIDYGIVGGLSFDINTKKGRFSIDARYYYGLSDIFSNAKRDVFSRSNHTTFSVKASYLLDLKK